MKKVSVKDFIIGALAAVVLIMLFGAGENNNTFGRYELSASSASSWGMVCVTDTVTGDTRCRTAAAAGVEFFTFTPDFADSNIAP